MTEATVAELETLFQGDLSLETYPRLRDTALLSANTQKKLEEMCEAIDPKSPKEATKKGIALWILGRSQQALQVLERGHPKSELASIMLGRGLIDLGHPVQARLRFREALAEHPDSRPIAYGLVHATLLMGELDEAMEILKKAEKRFGENLDTRFLRGLHLELTGEYAQAKQTYEGVVKDDARHGPALFRLAFWQQTWGDEKEAIELYERIRDLRPTFVNALLNLGSLYEDAQNYDRAIECFREVLDSIPNHPRALAFMADAMSSKTMFYDEDSERRADRQSAILKIPVTDFELSVRSRNCLNKMNIKTLGDLIQMTEPELLAHKNFGETSLMEVKQMLAQKGLRLGQGKIEGGAMLAPARPEVSEEVLAQHIDQLDLSVRSRKCMERLGITSIGQLCQKTEAELLSAKNFGQTSLSEIKMRLEERGLSLKDAPF
jgi:DNA-directed RNA polymerase subunit alpha